MLTNKIFDTFLAGLQQQQMNESRIASLAEGRHFEQVLERAKSEFEYTLSEKLLALTTEKQLEFLTQILALFERNHGLLNPQPRYLWYVDKLSDTDLVWHRESNEPQAVKAFRDECERQISADPEKFLAPLRAFSETAREARRYVWLVTNPGAIGVDDEIELDYDETDLHYEAARWIEEGLSARAGIEAQANVQQHFEKLTGKSEAMRWISSPNKWYDSYRESQGLPLIQEPFQNSYEAEHLYFSDLRTAAAPDRPDKAALIPPNSPWEPLLIGKMDLPAFFGFLTDCGLMTTNGEPTTLGQASGERKDRKAPWFGTLRALIDSKHLDNNAAVVCRAMIDPAGQINIKLSDNGLLYPSAKAGTYLTTANSRLKELGLLRK